MDQFSQYSSPDFRPLQPNFSSTLRLVSHLVFVVMFGAPMKLRRSLHQDKLFVVTLLHQVSEESTA